MKNKTLPTITVGIPAYNEEQNIQNLLRSILKQAEEGYRIEKIIVILDGCTDNTEQKVKQVMNSSRLIKLIVDNENRGKSFRLNQLYKLNQSAVIITLDADLILENNSTISNMIKPFRNKSIGVVGANNQAVSPKTFIESISVAVFNLWYQIRKDFNNGLTPHNFQGMAEAIDGKLAKQIHFPGTPGDGPFLYFSIIKLGKKPFFSKDSKVLINLPDNVRDFYDQANRAILTGKIVVSQTNSENARYFKIPLLFKCKGILQAFIKNPLYTLLGLLFLTVFELNLKKDPQHLVGKWNRVHSSKKAINL
ncbi:MAG: glycosyltransferase [Patescibacteria group bacterium]